MSLKSAEWQFFKLLIKMNPKLTIREGAKILHIWRENYDRV